MVEFDASYNRVVKLLNRVLSGDRSVDLEILLDDAKVLLRELDDPLKLRILAKKLEDLEPIVNKAKEQKAEIVV